MQGHLADPRYALQQSQNYDLDSFDAKTFHYVDKALEQDWANEEVMKSKSAATVGFCRWLKAVHNYQSIGVDKKIEMASVEQRLEKNHALYQRIKE